jgi:hypothetical protein
MVEQKKWKWRGNQARRGAFPTYIGEGAASREGCGQPLAHFLLFMMVVTPSFMER